MTESHAIASAVNTVKRWARGGGKVKPDTMAKAAAALAEWEAKKAAANATAAATQSFARISEENLLDALVEGGVITPGDEIVHVDGGIVDGQGEMIQAAPSEDPEIVQDIDAVASAMLSVSNDLREEAGLIAPGTRAAGGHFLGRDVATLKVLTEELAKTARSMIEPKSLIASGGALLAPVAPPKAWFDQPKLDGVTPITVTKDGRIYGHLATWDACHMESKGLGSSCVRAPRSGNGYAGFHLGYVTTAEGVDVPTGRIVAGAPHADPVWGLNPTLVHYSHSGWVGADVRVGEDRYGIWVAGALRPDISANQLRALKAAPLSGDWREDPRTGRLELVTALAVTAPGFQVPRPMALVASMGNVTTMQAVGLVAPKSVLKPGTEGALAVGDLAYLKERAAAAKSWAGTAEHLESAAREVAINRVAAFARKRTMDALSARVKEIR